MRRLPLLPALALSSLAASLSACAPGQPLVQVPTVEVTRIQLTGLTLPASSLLGNLLPGGLSGGAVSVPTANVALDLRVTNPNALPLNMANLGADLIVDGAHMGHVDLPNVALPARGTAQQRAEIALPVTLDTAANFLKVARGQLVTYRLDGAFTLNLGALGQPTFRPFTLTQGQWKQAPLLNF